MPLFQHKIVSGVVDICHHPPTNRRQNRENNQYHLVQIVISDNSYGDIKYIIVTSFDATRIRIEKLLDSADTDRILEALTNTQPLIQCEFAVRLVGYHIFTLIKAEGKRYIVHSYGDVCGPRILEVLDSKSLLIGLMELISLEEQYTRAEMDEAYAVAKIKMKELFDIEIEEQFDPNARRYSYQEWGKRDSPGKLCMVYDTH